MAETQTPNFKWTKPDLGGDAATWGNVLNTTIDAMDAAAYANQQAGVPIGSITMFGGATAPTNWLLCQGQTLDIGVNPQYTALKNLIGYAFGGSGNQFKLPNLGAQFPIGVGTNLQGVGTGLGQTGGNFLNGLAVANLPPHAHPIVDVAHNHTVNQSPHAHGITDVLHNHTINQTAHGHGDPGHTHGVTDPTHVHGASASIAGSFGYGIGASFPSPLVNTGNTGVSIAIAGAATGISIQGAGTGIQPQVANISLNASGTGLSTTVPIIANVSLAASGTGLSTTQNTGSGTGFNVIPPFVCLNFIIRYQ